LDLNPSNAENTFYRKFRIWQKVSSECHGVPTMTFFDPSGQASMILEAPPPCRRMSTTMNWGIAPPSPIVFFDRKDKLLFRTP